MASAIPENLMPELLQKSGDGMTATEIANWLQATHGISVTEQAVRKRIRRVQAERAPITNAILADKLSRTVGADLDRIEQAICRALEDELESRELASDYGKQLPGSDTWARLMHVVGKSRGDLTRLIELRLKLAGADDGSGKRPDAQDVQQRLVKRFEELIDRKSKPAGVPLPVVVAPRTH